jgi:hypothetical protein
MSILSIYNKILGFEEVKPKPKESVRAANTGDLLGFNVKQFLDDRCEFGYKLDKDGMYNPVVRCCGEEYTYFSELLRVIEAKVKCYVYIPYTISFESSLVPDCNKFVNYHGSDVSCDVIQWYIKRGYNVERFNYTAVHGYAEEQPCDDGNLFSFEKDLSVTELKDLIVYYAELAVVENADLIRNKEKFEREGPVFVKCNGAV